ncbi:MAG TPA: ferredoxin [Vicinamibacterales bacterium]
MDHRGSVLTRWFRRIVAAVGRVGGVASVNLPPPPGEFDITPRTPEANAQADKNVAGDFWVEADCCSLCGVPWHYAPDLFDYDDAGCWVKRQPVTADERERMLTVLQVQELGCIRYRGRDPRILSAISEE